MTKSLPSPELLSKILRYDPETGNLFWRTRTPDMFSEGKQTAISSCRAWNAKLDGKEAFTAQDAGGYRVGRIFGRRQLAHRVIWAIETGDWPVLDIDHVDHNPANNRIENLRDVTHQDNSRNASMSRSNTSGTTGVCWSKKSSKWVASIWVAGLRKHLGYFRCITAASIARKAAEVEHGYHENHGRQS